jgi:hypothetical protein
MWFEAMEVESRHDENVSGDRCVDRMMKISGFETVIPSWLDRIEGSAFCQTGDFKDLG